MTVLRGDARSLPLADDTVDLIVSSPPYFALRSYQDGGEHYAGQIGDEPTPAEFVDSLIEVTRECVRVLKPSGSIFVNLGDKFAERGGPERAGGVDGGQVNHRAARPRRKGERETGIRQKSLMGIPWRYALRCIDDLGLILRAEIIWSKPNGLPESVTDRVRRSHEQWFHFTLQPRYYSAVDEIREAQQSLGKGRPWSTDVDGSIPTWGVEKGSQGLRNGGRTTDQMNALNPLGKLPGSVWTIPTEPLTVPSHRVVRNGRTEAWFFSELDGWRYARRTGARIGRPSIRTEIDHFAAFPTEWPRRIIQGWSPPGICTACGEGRRPVVDKALDQKGVSTGRPKVSDLGEYGNQRGWNGAGYTLGSTVATITGYTCACPEPTAPTRPSVVLDPFGGTGTTALVAKVLGRHGISVDMSHDYSRLARWRTTDERQLAGAMRVTKPAVQTDGQISIFDLEEAP